MWRSWAAAARSLRVLRPSSVLRSSKFCRYNTTVASGHPQSTLVDEEGAQVSNDAEQTSEFYKSYTQQVSREIRLKNIFIGVLAIMVSLDIMKFVSDRKGEPSNQLNCLIDVLQSGLKAEHPSDVGCTQRLHQSLKLLATFSPEEQPNIDAVFHDIETVRQKQRAKYDTIIARYTRDLIEAQKHKDRGETTGRYPDGSDRAFEDLTMLRNSVISEIHKKYPKLKDFVDRIRKDVASNCSEEWRKRLCSAIPEGDQIVITLAKLMLLPDPIEETAEQKMYRGKRRQAEASLKRHLDSLDAGKKKGDLTDRLNASGPEKVVYRS
ncbi:hypothetical protein MMC10_007853 [Thelotrema lepadinum]|nr:hypothetical protein [Thelotrema lepadinum]